MTADAVLVAEGRPPTGPRRPWRPWFWLAAALLHAAIIALFFVSLRQKPPPEAESPPGVSVVFDNGGTAQTTAPQAQVQAPPMPAIAPPPASAPPPPQTEPEVNLNMPEMPLTALPAPAPSPQPQPQQQARRQPVQHQPRTPHYLVMNNMSFGNPSPPMPNAQKGLNLNLSQADLSAQSGPEISIQGDVGADWNAELNQWVEDHKYYPDSALEQGQEGSVKIHFTVDRNGDVSGLRLLSSSGSPFLDQAWFGLFKNAQLPPFPPGTKANNATIDATMHFIIIR